jgi:hypothetical protein
MKQLLAPPISMIETLEPAYRFIAPTSAADVYRRVSFAVAGTVL